MPWGSGPAWGEFGAPGWAGGSLSILPNSFLDRPSVVWCLDLYLASSFPWTFPVDLDAAPLRVSTLDLYPGSLLGDVLYEGRILEKPSLRRQTADPFGGLEEVDTLSCKLTAHTVLRYYAATGGLVEQDLGAYANLHTWVAGEHRGKVCIGHLVQLGPDWAADLVMQNLFRGEIMAMADDPSTVSIAARAFDMSSLTETVPVATVETSWAPYAPSGSLGRVVNQGVGIGRRIPCVPVKMRTEDSSLTEQAFTADFPTDTLAIPGHDFDTGDGAYRVRTTTTLPAGLVATVDYWVIVVDADTIRLATTRANALTAVAVPLTDNGTGGHTLYAGIAGNFDDDYDCLVGEGNLGILRVWEDAAAQGAATDAVPDLPITYDILHRTYKPTGSATYATAVRFHDTLDGTEITADVLRVYPDVDDGVVAEWKWLLGFGDDIGGHDAIGDPAKGTATSTADLTGTHQGYGLGSVQLAADKGLVAPSVTGEVFALQSFTAEVECFPDIMATGAFYPLLQGPQWDVSARGWFLVYDGSTKAVQAVVSFQDGSQWISTAVANSMPRGRPALVALRRDGTAGRTELWLNGDQIASDTRSAAIRYGAEPHQPLGLGCWPTDSANGFKGRLGWVRLSDGYRGNRYLERAYALWRRNGIEWCRELAESVGRPVNGTTFDTASAAWDAVEAGSLRCDGYLTDANELRAVLLSMVPFRSLRFALGADGRLEVTVPTPPTTVQASFGHGLGDQYANLLALPTRTRASLTEATQKLLVHFRRPRNGAEPFGGFEREVERAVFSVGSPETTLEMPFVDDPVTADIVADFAAKRRVTRDEAIDVAVGHEGRALDLGDLFHVEVPAMAIAADLEIITLAKGAERAELRGVPSNAADFTYTPMPLPADPADRTLRTRDLGNDQSLTATLVNGRVLLTLRLNDSRELLPIADGYRVDFPFLVGALSHWQAVSEPIADDAGSYVQNAISTAQMEVFRMPALEVDSGNVTGVTVRLRMRRGGSGNADVVPAIVLVEPQVNLPDVVSLIPSDVVHAVTSATFTDFDWTSRIDTRTGKIWTHAQVNHMHVGALVSGTRPVDLTRVALTVTQQTDPIPAGFVRYWVIGPSASPPPAPTEGDASLPVAEDFTPRTFDAPVASGIYWFYARTYDEFGRAISLLASNSVTVP